MTKRCEKLPQGWSRGRGGVLMAAWMLLSCSLGAAAQESPERAATLSEAAPPEEPRQVSLEVPLHELLDAAAKRYPRRREQQARSEIADRRLANLDARFKPVLEVLGQAAYHSQVPSLPEGFGTSPAKDQYTVSVNADQRLWDGGRTAQEKALEEAARDVDTAAVDVDFFAWRQQVEAAYFGALSLDAEIELLRNLAEDLEAQLEVLGARVRAGVALAGDRAVLAAELEGQRQRIVEISGERSAALELLAVLTGIEIPAEARLVIPEPKPPPDLLAAATAAAAGAGVGRPEMDQARSTSRLLQEQLALAGLAKKPTLSAFAQGGVGRPADQDFFETDPTPFVVLGLRLRWRPFDWGISEREQEIRRLDQEVSASRLETFLDSLSASLRQMARRIEASREALNADDRIVELRASSAHQAAAQLRAGVITPTAYLLERNAEHRARLTREQRRLRLTRDTVAFMTALGASS